MPHSDYTDQVGWDRQGANTRGGATFFAWRKGEMTTEEYYTLNAMLVWDMLGEYRPRQYPVLLPAVRQYAEKRMSDATPYDPPISKRQADWFMNTMRTFSDNEADRDHLLWAAETLDAKAASRAADLRTLAATFRAVPPPVRDFEIVNWAMKRDAEAREARGRQ